MRKFLLLVIVLISHPVAVFAQETISLLGVQGPFDVFTRVVEERFDVRIFYKQDWVAQLDNSIDIKGDRIDEVLSRALENTGLDYMEYSESNYVIAPSDQLSELMSLEYVLVKERLKETEVLQDLPMLNIGDSSQIGLSGESQIQLRLLDFANDETLRNGVLYIESLNLNSVSSPSGLINISVPSGVHLTEIRLVGYRPFIGYLSVLSDGNLDVYLDEEIIELEEIIVTGEGAQQNVRSSTAGLVSISPSQIKDLPVFLGESDVIKAILTLPGVSTLGEGTSGFFIRGGNIDQNLILQDGALFFNSSHALGFFSVFNPDLINNVTLYKGHIPAQYGGRLSSVLKVDLKGNIAEKVKVTGGIGTVMSKMALETPLVKDKTSLLVGGRFTYSDYLLGLTKNVQLQESSASFYDFNFRINQKIFGNGLMYLSYYQSGDKIQYERAFGFNWDIKNLAWGFNKPISENLFYELTFSLGNNLNESFNPDPTESYVVEGGQKYLKASQNVFATLNNHEAVAGMEWTNFNPEDEVLIGASETEQDRISRHGGHEFGIYVNDDWEISETISMSVGLRWSAFLENDSIGSQKAYFKNFEPRISVRVATGVTSSIKASYNRINQYLHLVTNTSSALPNDQWLASSKILMPKQADNYSLGFFKNFEFDQWESSAEVFYRDMRNLTETRNFANLILNPAIEDDIIQGDGRSYGIEFFVKKNSGRLKGALSYTYSRSLLYVSLESGQEPTWISTAFDRPHNLNFNLDYRFSRKAFFAVNFVFSSGRPITAPTSTYLLGSVVVPHYSERNEYSIPDYHRLDIAYTIKRNAIKRKRYQDSITFSIYNLYGRRNAFSVFFKKEENVAAKAYRLSILGSAFPSITYNFQF